MADRAGVNPQTLRYYERRGLLAQPPRSPSGYRDYPVSAVGVLRFVRRSQELGFTLAEIEQLLTLASGGPDSCDRARTLAAVHVAELDRKIADLRRMRASLTELVASLTLVFCTLIAATVVSIGIARADVASNVIDNEGSVFVVALVLGLLFIGMGGLTILSLPHHPNKKSHG